MVANTPFKYNLYPSTGLAAVDLKGVHVAVMVFFDGTVKVGVPIGAGIYGMVILLELVDVALPFAVVAVTVKS